MTIRFWATTLVALVLGIACPAWAGPPLIIVTSDLTGSPTPNGNPMDFPSEVVGATSPAQTETITVHMSATQGGSSVPVPGAFVTTIDSVAVDSPEFAVTGGTCTTSPANTELTDGNTCTVDLTFTPAAIGLRLAHLVVSCFVAEVGGVTTITCIDAPPPPPALKAGLNPQNFIGLRGIGLAGAIAAIAVPLMGNGALTLLALLLFAASMLAMRRSGR